MWMFPLKPFLWWILAKKQPILGLETSTQKQNTTQMGQKKNTTFGFKIKKFETILKPVWVSKKLSQN